METIASIKGTGDYELPSSVHKVVFDEDLLIEILVRLPLISLHLFRFVSKWWLSLITSPKFIMRRSQIPNLDPTSGLFLHGNRPSDEYDFLTLDIRIPANSYRLNPPALEGRTFKILDSCNGLLLCCTNWRTIYVYNPSINNMFKMLPKDDYMFMSLNCDDISGGSKMAFNPTKSPYYKVVNAQFMNSNCDMIQIQIYSSKTSNWIIIDDFDPRDFKFFSKGIYWNDAIHWLDCPNGQILHHKLDLEHQAKTNIYTHVPLDDTVDCSYVQLFESHGCLLFVAMFDTPILKMDVYEMSNDDSRWSVKYFVTLDEGWRSKPSNIWDSFGVLSIMLGEREEDLFLVMFLDGKVVRYDFVSRNVSTLTNFHSYTFRGRSLVSSAVYYEVAPHVVYENIRRFKMRGYELTLTGKSG
ncbi:F-box protein-like protein isoform X1 [Tanacetum coccineum]